MTPLAVPFIAPLDRGHVQGMHTHGLTTFVRCIAAEAEQDPPAARAAAADNPAVLPYRQWRVFWARHEVSSWSDPCAVRPADTFYSGYEPAPATNAV